MSPHQLEIAAVAYSESRKDEIEGKTEIYKQLQKDLTYTAYLISRWVWSKKVDIDKILDHETYKKEMTPEEMLKKVKALNAMFGGDVIDGKPTQ